MALPLPWGEAMDTLGSRHAHPSVSAFPALEIGRYSFSLAQDPGDFEEIHRLNHRTFVREIPQHADPGGERLVDRFHDKNLYIVARCGGRVVGMMAVHDQPPFSAAEKMENPEILEQVAGRILEVRLLSVESGERHRQVFPGLGSVLCEYARESGYTDLLISAIEGQRRMYERIGFRALGPAVRHGGGRFTPMILCLARLPAPIRRDLRVWKRRWRVRDPAPQPARRISLLPGPVELTREIAAAFRQPALYHRSEEFIHLFQDVRRALGQLAGLPGVALLGGSGTLANDCVAATLAADDRMRNGLILVNGEFGERLVRQARRAGLGFRVLRCQWGVPWDLEEVSREISRDSDINWVWGVHLETSTGVLNDLGGLRRCLDRFDVGLCVDCVSSIGAVPLDLRGVHLATGISGKSLGACPGISFVLTDPQSLESVDARRVPYYLDVRGALETVGPRFTFPSPELRALHRALESYRTAGSSRSTYRRHAAVGKRLREELRPLGIEPLAPESCAAPVVTTFEAPRGLSSEEFVERSRLAGYDVGGSSGYLRRRRLVQLATMGAVREEHFLPFLGLLKRWL